MNDFKNSKLPVSVRKSVKELSPYVPGLSIDEIKENYELNNVIKLASNENPLGISPYVKQILKDNLDYTFRYPQSGVPKLQKAIAEHHNIPKDMVIVGNGSDEIISLLIQAKINPNTDNILAFEPCFSIYKLQAKLFGLNKNFRQTPLNPNFSFPWDKLVASQDKNSGIAFITTPDNPSGYCPPVSEIIALRQALNPDCLLVIDEAYLDFSEQEDKYSLLPEIQNYPNVAILRTFSKSFGLAGLRLGYGIMHPALSEILHRVHLPFTVNILAEKAGLAALEDTLYRQKTLQTVREGRLYLSQELSKLGFLVYPSQANFIMIKPTVDPFYLFEELLKKGIIIRLLKSYNLPDFLRISIGTPEENSVLINACKGIIKNRKEIFNAK